MAIGIALPLIVCRVEKTRFFAVAQSYQPLFAFAVGLLVLSTSWMIGANEYLAAFAAGITLGNAQPKAHKGSDAFGGAVAELLKLAALLVWCPGFPATSWARSALGGYAFAVLALVVVRPLALGLALVGTKLPRRELAAALWFGPKGFASVVYGLLLLRAGVAHGEEMFHLIALVVAGSILAHSSTDVVVARWFEGAEAAETVGAVSGPDRPARTRARNPRRRESMRNKLSYYWDSLRTSFWFVPTVMALLAVGLAFAAVGLDRAIKDQVEAVGVDLHGRTGGARAVLAAIAGSMITVAGTVFSITIVALSLASGQFGPRCCATSSATAATSSFWAPLPLPSPTACWCCAPCEAPTPTSLSRPSASVLGSAWRWQASAC